MNRVIMVMVVAMLAGCAEEAVLNKTAAVTPKGETTGAAKTTVIGAAGGTLSSADGALSLIVPAGALTADTTLSITPLSVTAPGGLIAYRIGPEGTTFATAASLKITATEAQLAGTELPALRIAYQDAAGSWRAFTDATVDGRSIAVKTKHLSDWSLLVGWQLRPPKANVKVDGKVELNVKFCNVVTTDPGTDGELVSLVAECQEDEGLTPMIGTWAVNGTPNGNVSVGLVAAGSPTGVYTAPSTAPSPNTVAVSAQFNPLGRGNTLLVSNITIGDSALPETYTGTFTYHRKVGGPGTNVSFEEYRGSGTLNYVREPAQGPYAFRLTNGTFNLSSWAADQGNCDCTGSGTGALNNMDKFLRVNTNGTINFGWAVSFDIAVSCTPKNPGVSCQSDYPFGASWSLTGISGCTGDVSNMYTNPSALMGSWTQSCTADSIEESTWTLTGSN